MAIKYLSPQLLATSGFLEAFRSEAALLRSLDVPQVVRLFDYVEAQGQGAAIIMEMVDGVSLHEMITRQGPTSPESALLVLKGSLLGLAAAHALGIVHRDYKPENVLVDETGQSKLTDFGVAVRTGQDAGASGTPLYMSPEQWNGGPATPATDIYAATAVFFECLTGKTPFSGSLGQLAVQHAAAAVPVELVDEPLRELITRGMAKDPANRPSDATAFMTGLEATAEAAYGADWEDRGRGHLAERAAALVLLLLPHGEAVGAGAGTSTASTVLPVATRTASWAGRLGAHPWLYMGIAAAIIGVAAGSVAAVTVSRSHGGGTSSSTVAGSHPVVRVTKKPARWSAAAQRAPGPITSVSCASAFCVAVGAAGTIGHSQGYALTYQSGAWSRPVSLGNGDSYTVSCPAATFCMAVTDTGYAYTLRSGTWSNAADIDSDANAQPSATDALEGLSCATSSFCVAVTGAGNALTWDGTAWSAPQSIGLPGVGPPPAPGVFNHVSVSCPTPTYCLAGTDIDFTQAPSATWNGQGWTVTPQAPLEAANWNVSCASATFCMVAGGDHASGDQSTTWDGTAWSPLARAPDEGFATAFIRVSCPRDGSCVAVDGGAGAQGVFTRGSSVFTWSAGAWSRPQFTDPHGILRAISCTTAGLCVAADDQGYFFTFG